MHNVYCERHCRHQAIMRSGAAYCGRFAKARGRDIAGLEALQRASEDDEWGDPRFLKTRGCADVTRAKQP